MNKLIKKLRALYRLIISYLNNIFNNNLGSIIIPPTILNGSFGDELMVVSLVNHLSSSKNLLFTQYIIKRPDLFENHNNIYYQQWNTDIDWHKYSRAYLLGADNLSGTYGNEEVLKKISLLRKSHFYHKKIEILGFSLSKNITDVVKLALSDISSFTKFKLRDPNSYNRALTFLPTNKVEQVADVAFLCPLIECKDNQYKIWIEKQKKEGRKIIAICPNSIHMRNYTDGQYIQQYITLIESINKKGDYAFVLLYHDLRDLNKGWNDMKISEEIYRHIKSDNIYFTPDIINGVQLKSYLPFVDITLTSRMHLGISGYSVGKPMFGITYENKFSGLQKLFNITPEKSLVEFSSIQSAPQIFELFIADYEKNITNIKIALPRVMELAKKNFI